MTPSSVLARSTSGAVRPLLRAALACASLLAAASVAAAQSCPQGAFYPLDGAFVAGNGTFGFVPENNSTQIRVDNNGNGTIAPNEPVYDLPAPISGENFAGASLSLSPTRRVLMAVGGQSLPGCAGTSLRFYRLTPGNATPAVLHEVCVGTVLQNRVFFDRALRYSSRAPLSTLGSSIAAVLHAPSVTSPTATLSLFDLEAPGSRRVDITNLRSGIGDIRIAGGGQAMYVQHDLSPTNPDGTDYTLISLCSQTFGQQANPDGGFPLRNVSGGPLDAFIGPSANSLTRVSFTQSGGVFAQLNVRDCCAQVDPPGVAQLSLTQSVSPAAGDIPPGSSITYTASVANIGTAAATNVVVQMLLPSNTTLLSVSNQGGPLAPGSTVIQWTIPSLATLADGGTVTDLSFTVRAECATSDYSPRPLNATAVAANAPQVSSSLNSGPRVVMPPTTPLIFSVSTTPDTPAPLRRGDTLTMTLSITNPDARDQQGLRTVPMIRFLGGGIVLDSIIAASTGTATLAQTEVDWLLDLPAGATASLALRLRVDTCLPPETLAVAANGSIIMSNACGVAVLSTLFSSPAYLMAQDYRLSVVAGPLAPGQIGALVEDHQPVRAGARGVIEVRVQNNGPASGATGFWSLHVPTQTTIGTPALLPGTSPGVVYDAATRTLGFAGSLSTGQEVIALLNADLLADSPRSTLVLAAGQNGCAWARTTVHLCPVPTLPASALLGLDTREGVWVFDPAVDTQPRTFFSPIFGVQTPFEGFDIGPDGRLAIVGPRIVRLDTQTLELSMATTPSTPEGPLLPRDAAFDRVTGQLVISGTLRSGFGAALGTIQSGGTTSLLADLNTVTILAGVAPLASGGARVVSMPAAFSISDQGRGVIGTDTVTPIASLNSATAIPMPATPFTFTPAGSTLGPYPVAISPTSSIGAGSDDTWALVMHRWIDGPTFLPTSRTSAVSLLRIAAAGATSIAVDLVAGDLRTNAGLAPWPFDAPLTPLELSTGNGENRGASIAPGPGGSVYVASRTTLYRLDNAASGSGPITPTLVFSLPTDLSRCIDLASVGMGATLTGCSPADIANTDGSTRATGGGPDGAIDNGDFTGFFAAFFASPGSIENLDADIANTDGDTVLTGAGPDGTVDNGDFSAFFLLFFAGCP
jgi:uncharacterized repeat protein (TIGR01451 family)